MKVRRVDFFPDEYISGVGAKLTAEEQGVFWLVCALIYSQGGPIEDDAERIGRLCKLRPSKARRLIQRLVEAGKLHRDGGKLYQNRSETELNRAEKRIVTATENGGKGGRPRKKTQSFQQNEKAGGFQGEKLTTNHQPPTTNQDTDSSLRSESVQPHLDLSPKETSTHDKQKRRGRLPADWQPDEQHRDLAAEFKIDCDGEAEKFRDWAASGGETKLDWNAAFRNWLRREGERRGGAGGHGGRPIVYRQGPGGSVAAASRAAARFKD